MAEPVVREVVHDVVDLTDLTVFTGAATAAGDLLVVVHGWDWDTAAEMTGPTPGTWTLRASASSGVDGANQTVWTREVTTGGAQEITTADGPDDSGNWIHCYVIETGTWSQVVSASGANGTGANANAPSRDALVDDLYIAGWQSDWDPIDYGAGYAFPPSMTCVIDIIEGSSMMGSGHESIAVDGATGTRTATETGGDTWAATSILIRGTAEAQTIVPSAIPTAESVPSPTITIGTPEAIVIGPSAIPTAEAVPTPTITVGTPDAIVIVPSAIPTAESVPFPTVAVTSTVEPIEPTPPATRWQLLAGPASGGHELALTEARSRKLTVKLTEPSECSFTLDGRHPQATALSELATDVHVLYQPPTGPARILYRGRVGATADRIDADTHELTVASLDYRAVLDRRILWSDSQLEWLATDQADIARGLLTQTQTRPGGALGIDPGTHTTGVTRDRTYEAGDSIGERVQELSEVLDGFDWDVIPTSASGLALDIFHPARGLDRGVVLEHGGLVTSVQRQVDPGAYANAVRVTGKTGTDTDPGPTPVELEADDIAAVSQGRWDKAIGEHDIETQDALDDRVAWQLDESQVIRPAYTVTLRPDGWRGPDHIWVGDTVRLVVYSGRLAVDARLRVFELGVDIADTGDEQITLTIGAPKPDIHHRAARVERRLASLERR